MQFIKKLQFFGVRVLINYATYADEVTIHCLAEDTQTVVGPRRKVQSLETLFRLLKYLGANVEQAQTEIRTWGHGGVWVDVQPKDFKLLGIKGD